MRRAMYVAVAKRGHRVGCVSPVAAGRLSAFWFDAIVANITELFRSLEKPSLAALTLFVGC